MANTPAKKITYDSKPVQVESAIRDSTGLTINTTYVKKSTISVPSTVPTLSWSGTATIGSVDGKDFKVTMPGNPNTDTKVAQVLKTDNYDRPLLMSDQIISATTASPVGEARRNNSIYANTSTGKITSTLISATQVGGMTKTYELKATGYKTILQMKDAATYWTTHGGKSYIKALIEVSVTAPGTAAAADTKKGVWLAKCVYAGNEQNVTIESVNDAAGTGNGSLRYFATFVPKTTSYCPQIAVALDNANTKVYITVTILSATDGWQMPSSIGGDPGTTNYTRSYWEVGRYNYNWSGSKISANITGSCDGTSGSTWDSLRNDRYVFGESAVAGSIMAKASDGRMYKLRNGANKEFTLPLHLGRSTGTFTYDGSVNPPTLTNYAQIMWNMRGMAYAELTNTTMQTTAFTVPTLTSSDFGKTLYVTGTLSNGNFKPDGNITLTMVNGKTNVPIGRIDRANVALNTTPAQFTITGYSQNAYTLDTFGRLTHIDGKKINRTLQLQNVSATFSADTTYTAYPFRATISVNGVTSESFADVVFSDAQAKAGIYAPFCVTGADVVYVYARLNPGTIIIPTVSVGFDDASYTVDATPTSGSPYAVTSGGVYDALNWTNVSLVNPNLSGITITKQDNNNASYQMSICRNLAVIKLAIRIKGTYSGTSGWVPIFNYPSPYNASKFLPAYMMFIPQVSYNSGGSYTGTGHDTILQGNKIYLSNGEYIDHEIRTTYAIPVVDGGI